MHYVMAKGIRFRRGKYKPVPGLHPWMYLL